ncbi:hypothetical protein [Burkholderia ubonensis]|uniref:hypothetical protein n=1 Tax=Burkholderia ubonensis TaxID=101571 RepID=UPI0012F82CDE|nr:hypothetical protein [Burkholderia ubonensis]
MSEFEQRPSHSIRSTFDAPRTECACATALAPICVPANGRFDAALAAIGVPLVPRIDLAANIRPGGGFNLVAVLVRDRRQRAWAAGSRIAPSYFSTMLGSGSIKQLIIGWALSLVASTLLEVTPRESLLATKP